MDLVADPERRACALDELARRGLARLLPLRFEPVRDPADIDAVLRMRFACVVHAGWATPADYPDGRERDEYDESASFVVCRDGGILAGALRLIPPSPGRPLPIEREFGIRLPIGALEAGRVVVPPEMRAGRSHRVLAGLCARGWLLAREMGYDRVVSAAEPALIELYQAFGMRISELGPQRLYWGATRIPIEIAGAADSFAFLGLP